MTRIGSCGAAFAALLSLLAASTACAAPAWNPTTNVSSAGVNSAVPAVAVDARGNALALWVQSGAKDVVVYSDHPAGGSWTTPVVISDPAHNAGSPAVSFDANGNAFASWVSGPDGYHTQVHASYRPAGGNWQTTPDLFGNSGVVSFAPTLAVDARGDEVLGWVSYTDGTFNYSNMWGAYRPAGGSWTAATQLSGGTTKPAAFQPAAAIDAQGNAVLLWVFRDYNAAAVHAIIQLDYYHAAAWNGAAANMSDTSHDGLAPKIAQDRNGNITAVWADDDGAGHQQIVGIDWTKASGIWSSRYGVSAVGTTVAYPSLAFGPSGDAVAAWTFRNAIGGWIQSSTRPAGGSWPASGTNISNSLKDSKGPTIATGASGDTVVAWPEQPVQPGAFHVDAAVKPAGAAWSAPYDASASPKTAADPAVAIDAVGNSVVLWDQLDGSNTLLKAGTYSAPTITSGSIPSSGVVGQQLAFSVNPFDVWSPLTTTWQFGDGTQAVGTSVTHTYASAGPETVTVSTVNAGTATATRSGVVTITSPTTDPGNGGAGGGPAASPTPTAVSPTLTAVSQSHPSWARADRLAYMAATRRIPVGTTFSLTLNKAATLAFAFARSVVGRSTAGRCVAVRSSNRKHGACRRIVSAGTLTIAGHAGTDKIAFFGALSRSHRLAKGAYTVSITATDAGGRVSAPARLAFTIAR